MLLSHGCGFLGSGGAAEEGKERVPLKRGSTAPFGFPEHAPAKMLILNSASGGPPCRAESQKPGSPCEGSGWLRWGQGWQEALMLCSYLVMPFMQTDLQKIMGMEFSEDKIQYLVYQMLKGLKVCV